MIDPGACVEQKLAQEPAARPSLADLIFVSTSDKMVVLEKTWWLVTADGSWVPIDMGFLRGGGKDSLRSISPTKPCGNQGMSARQQKEKECEDVIVEMIWLNEFKQLLPSNYFSLFCWIVSSLHNVSCRHPIWTELQWVLWKLRRREPMSTLLRCNSETVLWS